MDIQLSTGASTADRVKEGRYAVNLLKNATSFEPFYAQWQQLQAESESCSPSLDYQYCKLAAKRVIAEARRHCHGLRHNYIGGVVAAFYQAERLVAGG
jgi:CelD/BcsL family acetyltransferase involved in cellulose biosynthesis